MDVDAYRFHGEIWRGVTCRVAREASGKGRGGGGSEGAARTVPGVECFSGRQIVV